MRKLRRWYNIPHRIKNKPRIIKHLSRHAPFTHYNNPMEVIKNLMLTDKVICYSSEGFKDITGSCGSVHINISLNKLVDLPDDECIEYFNNLTMNKAKKKLLNNYQGEPVYTQVQFVYKLT